MQSESRKTQASEMNSSAVKALAKTFQDKPDVQLALHARATVLEASENATRNQRRVLESSEVSVSIPLGELAQLYHAALRVADVDDAFDPNSIFAKVDARLKRARLLLLGWEGEAQQ